MTADRLQPSLDAISARRASISDLGAELKQRIDDLGAVPLDTRERQAAFSEVIEAITPPNFDLFLDPDECTVDPAGRCLVVVGVVVDLALRQFVGVVSRKFVLDEGRVEHSFLKLQRAYRGRSLATLLLDRSFQFYDAAGITKVQVHAALETGRWYWARLGFGFATPRDQALVSAWGTIGLQALGEPMLPASAPSRRWAQLGTGDPPTIVSLHDLQTKIEAFVTARQADAATQADYDQLELFFSHLFQAGWTDEARFRDIARLNELDYDEPIMLGRAIMLTGPDWHGTFDLTDSAARSAFAEELNRALKRAAKKP